MQGQLRIDQMYAFVVLDKDGTEGVAAMMVDGGRGWLPMVGADMARVESLKPLAQQLAKERGVEIRLLRFGNRELVETFKP